MNNTEASGHLLMAQLFCGVCAIDSQTREDSVSALLIASTYLAVLSWVYNLQ